MPKFRVYGVVTGGKFIGVYEGDTAEEAESKAWEDAHVSICHQCAEEIDDPEIHELQSEEVR